jgi:hypothetical protein
MVGTKLVHSPLQDRLSQKREWRGEKKKKKVLNSGLAWVGKYNEISYIDDGSLSGSAGQ